ncbi:MAG: hypothetical protein Q8P67_29005, partial [archaeon]|nr:hypothetical protein [archaeon]
KDKLREHLDWHSRMKQREKQKTKKAVSRQWYLTTAEWMDYQGYETQPLAEATPFFGSGHGDGPAEPFEKPTVPVGDREFGECAVCGEDFDKVFDKTSEDWYFDDAIASGDLLYHPKCMMSPPHSDGLSDEDDSLSLVQSYAD